MEKMKPEWMLGLMGHNSQTGYHELGRLQMKKWVRKMRAASKVWVAELISNLI
jgi:hypothetical protein